MNSYLTLECGVEGPRPFVMDLERSWNLLEKETLRKLAGTLITGSRRSSCDLSVPTRFRRGRALGRNRTFCSDEHGGEKQSTVSIFFLLVYMPLCLSSALRTLIVRMISTAQTGYFYTTQRLRQGASLAAVKYDPKGMFSSFLSPLVVFIVSLHSESKSFVCREPENREEIDMRGPSLGFAFPSNCIPSILLCFATASYSNS